MLKRQVLTLLSGALILSGCAANTTHHLQYHANPKKAVLPAKDGISLNEPMIVKKGEKFLVQPVGFIKAAILKSSASFQIAGKDLEVTKDRVLQFSHVRTPKVIEFPKDTEFYCDLLERNPLAALAAATTLGLSTIGSKTALNTRTCLLDSDKNGAFDQAILIGNNEHNQQPVDITPVEYEIAHHIPLDDESTASIEYVGTSFTGKLIFELNISEYGDNRSFSNKRQVIKPDQLPIAFKQFGAEYTVLSFDEETKDISVTINKPFPIAQYNFFTTYSYGYY